MLIDLKKVLSFKRFKTAGGYLYILRNPPKHVAAYYSFCIEQLIFAMSKSKQNKSIALIFPEHVGFFPDKVSTVCLQIEHTLVLRGGRGVDKEIYSSVATSSSNEKYLVRIDNVENLKSANIILEYSLPNIYNVTTSPLADVYKDKVFYIPPFYLSKMINPTFLGRNCGVVSTMMSAPCPGERRFEIIEKINENKITLLNIENLWDDPSLVFSKTAILLNLHQTDHHHTLEELRILPAILQGVVVISEQVPLLEQVPYAKFFISVDKEDLSSTLHHVQNNYEKVWNSLFLNEEFENFKRNQTISLEETIGTVVLQSAESN